MQDQLSFDADFLPQHFELVAKWPGVQDAPEWMRSGFSPGPFAYLSHEGNGAAEVTGVENCGEFFRDRETNFRVFLRREGEFTPLLVVVFR
jgi:hypothetical protein